MLDKIYYGLATISVLFVCCKECYNSLFKKEEDYLKVQTYESDTDLNYIEYIDNYDGVPMDYDEFKKKNIINKKTISIDLQ
tara:strand:+ start:2830 stop:3072 length:243 start_codon:yes stop_codon:yes gene_type:complete